MTPSSTVFNLPDLAPNLVSLTRSVKKSHWIKPMPKWMQKGAKNEPAR